MADMRAHHCSPSVGRATGTVSAHGAGSLSSSSRSSISRSRCSSVHSDHMLRLSSSGTACSSDPHQSRITRGRRSHAAGLRPGPSGLGPFVQRSGGRASISAPGHVVQAIPCLGHATRSLPRPVGGASSHPGPLHPLTPREGADRARHVLKAEPAGADATDREARSKVMALEGSDSPTGRGTSGAPAVSAAPVFHSPLLRTPGRVSSHLGSSASTRPAAICRSSRASMASSCCRAHKCRGRA